MGTLPHLAIEWQTNDNTLFQGAWDEDFYLLTLFGVIPEWNNYPIRDILQSTITVFHLKIPDVVFWFDIIFPFITVIVAGQLSMLLVSRTYSSLITTFLLVYGSEILSLNSSLFTIPIFDLTQLISTMDIENKKYFLDTYATFFSIYRTPEPQLSYVTFLYFVKTLVKFYQQNGNGHTINITFYILSMIATFIYPFFALASVGLNIILTVCVLIERNYRLFWQMLPILFLSSITILFVITSYYSKEANATIFQSRTPLFSMSVTYSIIFILIIIGLKYVKLISFKDTKTFPFLAMMFPMIVLNQQILTGHAVQAINWERYVNIPVLIVSVILVSQQIEINYNSKFSLLRKFDLFKHKPAMKGLTNTFVLIFFTTILTSSQFNNYRQWLYYNILVETYGLALKEHYLNKLTSDNNITLKDMSASSAIIVRSEFLYPNIKGYHWIISNSFGSFRESDKSVLEAGFEYASRLGLSTDQYKNALVAEVDGETCWPHMMFIASFLECAPYVSDFRNYDKNKLKKKIDVNVKLYDDYIKNHARQVGYLFTTEMVANTSDNNLWENTLISETTLYLREIPRLIIPRVSVYLYRQTPK
jgi:hypothetical protein